MGDLCGSCPPPLLGEPRPPALLPFPLSIVVELNAVQSLPTVPPTDHCNFSSSYSYLIHECFIIVIILTVIATPLSSLGGRHSPFPNCQASLLVGFKTAAPHLQLSVPSWFENNSSPAPHLQLIVQTQTWAYSSAHAECPRTFGSHVCNPKPTHTKLMVVHRYRDTTTCQRGRGSCSPTSSSSLSFSPVILPPIVPTLGLPHRAVLRSATYIIVVIIVLILIFIDKTTNNE